ncbi:MAG: helix-turn-helix transcriptional regulator [Desulfobulbus sp.]
MQQITTTAAERFLRLGDVLERTALSRSTVYKKIQEGDFPPPVKVGLRASRWKETSVNQWINEKVNQTGTRAAV